VERAFVRAKRGDENDPEIRIDEAIFQFPEYLSHVSFRRVSLTGLSYFLARYEPGRDAVALALEIIDDDLRPGFLLSFTINKTKLTILLEAPRLHADIFPHDQTLRRFLPFALLLFRTRRPFFVLMRLRNPCVVFLRVLCG